MHNCGFNPLEHINSLLGDAKTFGALVVRIADAPDPAFSNKSCYRSAERRPVLAKKVGKSRNIEIRAFPDGNHGAVLQWGYAFLSDFLDENCDSNLLKPANEVARIGIERQE